MRGDVASRAAIAEDSFLRHADPRTKVALAFAASAAVALPLTGLVLVAASLAGLLVAGGLGDRS